MESPLEAPRGAPGEGRPTAPGSPSKRDWMVAGAAAAVVFLVLDRANDFIATPLREWSSVLAQAILQVAGFPVTRQGTILSTPRAVFDVIPACSGSTTLQVLLFLAIVWCGVHPRLTFPRRIAAMLLAVPLAILANGVRVAALVAMGHAAGGEPDEVVHALTGIVAFALAMVGCFAITQRLATTSTVPVLRDRTLSWILGAILAFLSLPFFSWGLENWGRHSLDRFGYVFIIAAAALATWRWRKTPDDRSQEGWGTAALGLSLLALAVAARVEVNSLKGISLILAFLSLSLALKGIRFALLMLPVAGIAYLGFPSVSYQLGVLTSWSLSGGAAFFGVKAALAIALGALLVSPLFRPAADVAPSAPRRFLQLQLLMAALVAAFQTYTYGFSGGDSGALRLEMSYLQGPWVGRDNQPPANESDYFGRHHIWSKRFTRDRETVDVLVTSTGGDRHRAHPPAYCVTGDGWKSEKEEITERKLGDGAIVPMTRLRLRKGDQEMLFCYWFTDGAQSKAAFSGMLWQDTLRRLGGRRADWFVFRVMSTSGEAALDDFLSRFQARLASGAPTPRP